MVARTLFAGTLGIAIAAAGCGKKGGDGGADCKPLTVTIGGEAVAGLGNGLGHSDTNGHTLYLYNHDKTTCEQILAPSRTVPEGEESVGFGVGGYGPSIGYDSNGVIGQGNEVKLVKKPSKVGDPIAMCVKAKLPIKIGKNKGKELVAEGLVEGKYCGERK